MKTAVCEQQQYRQTLEKLARDMGGPHIGFFGPKSGIWRVNREIILHLSGPRALLLQLAHPMVAQGVGDHSNFKQDFWGRAIRTFTTVYALIFGTQAEAIKAALRMKAVHQRIQGKLAENAGRFKKGTPYQASDPNLLRWVYATLVDSAHTTFETYVRPNDSNIMQQSYAEIRRAAPLFGFPSDDLPTTWTEFKHWMNHTIASDEIMVTDLAREIAKYLLAGPPGLRRVSPLVRIVCTGMLPEKLRTQFDLRWDLKTRAAYKVVTKTAAVATNRAPQALRTIPIARSAQHRCKNTGQYT